jgi:AcrR family transcriptional regulator
MAQRSKENTKDRLVEAVGALIGRDGLGAVGVNAVAREAGVDKVLIYRYFGGMDELLNAFGRSRNFWPSLDEIIGDDPADLMAMSLGDRWALGLSRYARALRDRPVTKEILAWEQVEQNELTDILRDARQQWFEDLMSRFPNDQEATDVDLTATILVIVGAIHYLVVRSRLQPDFSGLELETEQGWAHIESVITTMCRRTLEATG